MEQLDNLAWPPYSRQLLRKCDAYFHAALPNVLGTPLTDLCGDSAITFHSDGGIWRCD